MKLDDLIAADSTDASLDPDLVDALRVFGFTTATYTLFTHPTHKYVATIYATRPDGTGHTWVGTGKTPDEAYQDVLDSLAKWVVQQPPLPFTP